VDLEQQTVTFERCHWRRSFWAVRPDRAFTCAFADILAVHDSRIGGVYTVTVVTRGGKATLYQGMSRLQDVRDLLASVSAPSGGPILENPNVRIWLLALLAVLLPTGALWWAPGWEGTPPPAVLAMLGGVLLVGLVGWLSGRLGGKTSTHRPTNRCSCNDEGQAPSP
jgi:hypothetical protein